MNISLKWLGRYVDLSDKTPQQIMNDLTLSTAEVEELWQYAGGLESIVVGHVVEREAHPDADKLSVCKVDIGNGELQQIVCGAPNVAAGMNVPVITPGSKLPDGTKIKKGKIRGQVSLGMICSEKELGIADEADGIMVLPEGIAPGTKFNDALDVTDNVIEIDNKSINHRPDLWGHYGIARELAAIYERPLKPLDLDIEIPSTGKTIDVSIEDLQACPRYTGLVIEGCKAVPTPDWMKYLLSAVGQRSINLLVDLTNFVMLECGQPMHAFDLRKIDGKPVAVRCAREGEASMKTLDGEERQLNSTDLLITSGGEAVALAGIMGGEGSMVEDDTTDLFLESATFHAATIRRTGVRLGLRTDSSARFEKTLDPAMAETAARRFLKLLQQECPGAKAAGPMVDPSAWAYEQKTVTLRRARLDLKLGVTVSDAQVEQILSGLEFGVTKTATGFDCTVPSFRATKDISIEDDLIEEVGRMYRYDNIPEQALVATVNVPERDDELYFGRQIIQIAATEMGMNEVYNYSFVPDKLLEAFGASDFEYSRVSNPVAPEITRMRRHVLPSVVSNLQQNLALGEVRLFEKGKGYHPEHRDEHGLPFEVSEIAFAWTQKDGAHPYAELRTQIESLLSRIGATVVLSELMPNTDLPWIHPGKTVAITIGETCIGYVGSLHPQVCRDLKLPLTTAIASLDLRAILSAGRTAKSYSKISPFPEQPVDVAFLVPVATRVGDIAAFLSATGRKMVRKVELFEVYQGEGIPAGKKSLNFTVTLGAMDRTLSSKDEEKYLNKVREKAQSVGAELRG